MDERRPFQHVDQRWLQDRGGLHDAHILEWRAQGGSVTFKLHDVWWNFEGFPEYKGPEPGLLIISEAQNTTDCAPIVSELLLDAELISSGDFVGLRLHTIAHPPIEILGKAIRWHPQISSQGLR